MALRLMVVLFPPGNRSFCPPAICTLGPSAHKTEALPLSSRGMAPTQETARAGTPASGADSNRRARSAAAGSDGGLGSLKNVRKGSLTNADGVLTWFKLFR